MNRSLIGSVVLAAVCFILIGVAMNFGPDMLAGFEEMRTADNVTQYTALETVVEFGPTMILLGFIVSVAIAGFMGIRIASKK